MNRILCGTAGLALAALMSPLKVAQAKSDDKEEDRLKNSGVVLKEVLDVPDDISQRLLDKEDCIVVFPSVVTAAFGH